MTQPFCVAPFVNFFYKGNVPRDRVLPCCEARVDRPQPKQTYEQWWSGKWFKEIRESMMAGQPHEICTRCINVEQDGGYNAREFYKQIAERWQQQNDTELEWNTETGTQLDAPISVDYRSSNLCNLKCRMCHPSNSTEIAREVIRTPGYEHYGMTALKDQLFNRNEMNEYIKDIPLQHVKRFKALGGEPLIQQEVYHALDDMLEHEPETVTIIITTNGTTIPFRFIEYLDKFKQFNIRISLDGIDDIHEYIRTNANWHKILGNCHRFAELSDQYPNLQAGFSFVVQAYNAFQLAELAEFCIDWNRRYPNWREPFFAPVEQDWLSTAVLDDEDIALVVKQLHDVNGKYPGNTVLPQIFDIVQRFDVKRDYKETDREKWVNYTNLQDGIRNTSIVNLDKRFRKYFDE